MVRAVYEGVAFEHRGHIDHLLTGRQRPRAARFAGGAARSRPWLDIFASAIDLPLELSLRRTNSARWAQRSSPQSGSGFIPT